MREEIWIFWLKFDAENSKIEGDMSPKVPKQKFLGCRKIRFQLSQKCKENFLLEEKGTNGSGFYK